nr:hypothetical protein [uncultured Desulfobacter sp.]
MFRFKSLFSSIFILVFLFMISGIAHATLTTIGTGTYNGHDCNLIWDDDNNGNSVVWLDYTNDPENWADQVGWASSLNGIGVLTYNIDFAYTVEWKTSSWRLPITVDGEREWGYDGTTTAGYNIISSEMGHLYYEELGNLGDCDTSGNLQSGWGLTETGDFENLIASWYWSGPEYANKTSYAWYFDMYNGTQDGVGRWYYIYGLAVRSGQVSAVPVPGTALLLNAGLLGLAAAGRKTGRGV